MAIQDKQSRRPRFDPTREQAVAKRIAEKRKAATLPQREHQRDPSTEGPPDVEEARRLKRRFPPPPPPVSTQHVSSRNRPLAFARPPLRRDSATESSFVPSEREPLRLRVRVEGTPPQRPMPKRVLAQPIGSSAPPRLQTTSHRPVYQGQSQVRGDRSHTQDRTGGWYGQQEYAEQGQVRPAQEDLSKSLRHLGINKEDRIGAHHKEELHLRVIGKVRLCLRGWNKDNLVNTTRIGDSHPPTTQERWQDPHQGHQQHPSSTGKWTTVLAHATTTTITATTTGFRVTGTCVSSRDASNRYASSPRTRS